MLFLGLYTARGHQNQSNLELGPSHCFCPIASPSQCHASRCFLVVMFSMSQTGSRSGLWWVMLHSAFLQTCCLQPLFPYNICLVTVSCSALLYNSSLAILSCCLILKMTLRHVLIKVCNFCCKTLVILRPQTVEKDRLDVGV